MIIIIRRQSGTFHEVDTLLCYRFCVRIVTLVRVIFDIMNVFLVMCNVTETDKAVTSLVRAGMVKWPINTCNN